jgi:hypothetical protein
MAESAGCLPGPGGLMDRSCRYRCSPAWDIEKAKLGFAWEIAGYAGSGAGYIRSGTGTPSRPSPCVSTRRASAHNASLLSRTPVPGACSTGHSS